jgi:hypothetical protein
LGYGWGYSYGWVFLCINIVMAEDILRAELVVVFI